jgi:hypothetical protein
MDIFIKHKQKEPNTDIYTDDSDTFNIDDKVVSINKEKIGAKLKLSTDRIKFMPKIVKHTG